MGYKCDKCGKEVEYIKYCTDENDVKIPCHYSFVVDLSDDNVYSSYELCKECYEKIKKEMKPRTKQIDISTVLLTGSLVEDVFDPLLKEEYCSMTFTEVHIGKLINAIKYIFGVNKITIDFNQEGKYKAYITYKNKIVFYITGDALSTQAVMGIKAD